MSNKSIAEVAKELKVIPAKLLGVVQETHPDAQLHNKIEPDALEQCFCNYEKNHGLKSGPAHTSNPRELGDSTTRAGNSQQKEKVMQDFYDEQTVTAQAAQEWTNDPNLRQEFGNDEEAWIEFSKANAEGLVRTLGAPRNV